MAPATSSCVTPCSRARIRCDRGRSGRFRAIEAPTVIWVRSLLTGPGAPRHHQRAHCAVSPTSCGARRCRACRCARSQDLDAGGSGARGHRKRSAVSAAIVMHLRARAQGDACMGPGPPLPRHLPGMTNVAPASASTEVGCGSRLACPGWRGPAKGAFQAGPAMRKTPRSWASSWSTRPISQAR
jgi:hypothetical protein